MSVRIRLAHAADSPEVVRVIKAVYDEFEFPWYPEGYHADLYDLDGHYAAHGHRFFLAERENIAVGTAAMVTHPRIPGEPGGVVMHDRHVRVACSDCSLERLYVHPEGRRGGVGAALLEAVMQTARDRNCKLMELWSDVRFTDAHRLYERMGARVVGERLCHDPEQSPEWGLALPI